MIPHDPLFIGLAVIAVMLAGLGKGGFSGMGTLSVPVMALVISPVKAAAIMLPILILQDVVGVWAFRKSWSGFVLGWTLPGAMIGIGIAWFFAKSVPVTTVLGAVGAVSVLFGLYRLVAERWVKASVTRHPRGWVGFLAGTVSGTTSQIAHAGQPPFQVWVLPQKLERDVLVGTSAIYFATVNWAKVPAYWALGQFTRGNLLTSAALAPVAILSTLAGVWLVRRVSPERFYTAIYVLMIGLGCELLFEAL